MLERLVSVVIADDHPLVLEGLRHWIPRDLFRIVGEATTGKEAIETVRCTEPDVVILDLRFPDYLAPDICREIRRFTAKPKILILTGLPEIRLLQACVTEGAIALLLKDDLALDIATVLRDVLDGRTVIDPRLGSILTDTEGRPSSVGKVAMTAREHDVLRLVARGFTSREIAAELYLSVNTVRTYVQTVLVKLGVHSRIEALAVARHSNLI